MSICQDHLFAVRPMIVIHMLLVIAFIANYLITAITASTCQHTSVISSLGWKPIKQLTVMLGNSNDH